MSLSFPTSLGGTLALHLRALPGRYARTATTLVGEGATLPAGALVRLQRADGRHVALEAAPCAHCGVAARVIVRFAEAPSVIVIEVPPGVAVARGGRQ